MLSFEKGRKAPYTRARTPTPGRKFIAGRDRVGGYYGRYAGPKGELKFHDVNLDDAVVATAGTVTPTINIIAQGVTESQRIGRKCTIKQINWRYDVILPEIDAAGTPGSGDSLRIIIFIDKQANGATAAVTDLLETANFLSFRNLANSGRFTFLMDKMHNINYAGLASDGAGVVSQANRIFAYSWYKRCNLPIEYSSTTGAIGEIRSNNIGVCLLSRSGVVQLDSHFRLRFSDN